jgi:predicted transcriptional regulator
LAEALAIIRGKDRIEEDELEIIIKIARDCLPIKIMAVFQCLLSNEKEITSSRVGTQCRLNTDSVRIELQNLVMLGVAYENREKSNRYLYKLDDALRQTIKPIKEHILNKLYIDLVDDSEESREPYEETKEPSRG